MLKKNIFLWIFSFIITLTFAFIQRITGPTYPVKGKKDINGKVIKYKFPRSCEIGENKCVLTLESENDLKFIVRYKRYKTNDSFSELNFIKKDSKYIAILPPEPPAGKVEYFVIISDGKNEFKINLKPVVVRFKGSVPSYILIPHILFMFLFMLFSVKIFFSNVIFGKVVKHSIYLNYIFLIIGGFIFGPLTQYYAFGEYWTGFPYGYDLTDNKTLIMLIFWSITLFSVLKNKNYKFWINLSTIITFIVYLIPHSLFGSELDYSKIAK